MENANPTFERREMQLEAPDLAAFGLNELLAHPDLIILEDNDTGGRLNGAPILLTVERHLVDQEPSAPSVGLTLHEMHLLRNYLTEAIIYAERLG